MKHLSLEEKRRGFRIHAIAFVLTLALLAIVNLLTGAPYWVLWVVPGWAIGILAHWFFVLGPGAVKSDGDRHAPASHRSPRHNPRA